MGPERDDRALRELARTQGNVFSLDQAQVRGVSEQCLSHRVRRSQLTRVHQRVYAYAPELTWRGLVFAALLACGPVSVASHRLAAAIHGLRPSPAIEVTMPRRRRRKQGVISHVARVEEHVVIDGIRVTTVERTLLDLCDVVAEDSVAKAFRESVRQQKLDAARLRDLLARSPGRRGIPVLTGLLEQHARHGTILTRSRKEELLLAICQAGGLPFPRTNHQLGPDEVDAYFPDHGVVVEVDTPAFHGDQAAMDRDSRKRTRLTAQGLVVLVVTDGRLQHDPSGVARDLRSTLLSRSGPGASGS